MQAYKFFTDEELAVVLDALPKLTWEDGKQSAHGFAKEIKNNQQAFPRDENFAPITNLLNQKFFVGGLRNIAFAKSIVGVRINSYGPGDSYGWHVDFAHMGQKRTDMSFTIFLSDKSEYDGGELEMEEMGRKASVKMERGHMVLYPTGILHRVKPITRGKRVCIVGWIESLIPNESHRTALVNLNRSVSEIRKSMEAGEVLDRDKFDKLNQTYFQITRLLTP